MCGILGYKLFSRDAEAAHQSIGLFEQLLLESQIRGKHATGIAYVDGGQVRGAKKPIPASEFIETDAWSTVKCYIPTEMIAHTRYSTSGDWHDNKNNQPLNNRDMALVHNGLVSMASKEEFEAQYQVATATSNDSEIILRKALGAYVDSDIVESVKFALEEVHRYAPPIFACAFLDRGGNICVVRDHLRPLWLFLHKSWCMAGFASTRDIIQRAMKTCGQYADDYTLVEAKPYHIYGLGEDVRLDDAVLDIPFTPEVRWTRPTTKNKMMTGIDFRSKRNPVALRADGAWLTSATYDEGDHRDNLRESFKRYCVAAIATWEIDPNYPLFNYLFRRYELSKSQEYWVCFLYGVFYHPASVFYVMQEFPEFEKVDLGRLKRWHAANWQKLRYNTDRKYEKGHFVEMFESYLEVIGGQTSDAQSTFFDALLQQADNPQDRFRVVERALRKLLRFGRYATYIYTEALARCMGMPIAADTMFLREAKSSRTGLAIVLGMDSGRVGEGHLSAPEWVTLQQEGESLMREIQTEYPDLGMDHWFMESCLCAYKGFFRTTKGRYLPYYLDRMLDEIHQLYHEDITSGIEWKVLYQFRRERIIIDYLGEYASPRRWRITKELEHVLRDTGKMIGLWPVVRRGILPETRVG